jgi:hypothetical protein
LTKFVIEGTDDEARAALKASFDAQDAAFQAGLDAMFKSPPPPNVTEVPAAAAGWPLETERNRRHKR